MHVGPFRLVLCSQLFHISDNTTCCGNWLAFPSPSPRSPGSSYRHKELKQQDLGAKLAVSKPSSQTEQENTHTHTQTLINASSLSSLPIKKLRVQINSSLPPNVHSSFQTSFFFFVSLFSEFHYQIPRGGSREQPGCHYLPPTSIYSLSQYIHCFRAANHSPHRNQLCSRVQLDTMFFLLLPVYVYC